MAMEEKDRWSAHVEYLKLAIALATALVAAAAAIYVDASKIPTDNSRYLLLIGVSLFFLTLITSLWSLARLGSHLLHYTDITASRSGKAATTLVNFAFILLALGASLLGTFFGFRTVAGGGGFERAIATSAIANKALIDPTRGETTSLKSLEMQGQTYQLAFQVNPGSSIITVVTDAAGTTLQSIKRQ
jgi:hypothetical protein